MTEIACSFDDYLLVPQFSEVRSRSEVDVSVKLSKGIELKFPVTPANMRDVLGLEAAKVFYDYGCLIPYHRFCPVDEQISVLEKLKETCPDILNYFSFSVGVKQEDYDNLSKLVATGVKILTMDVAHADSVQAHEMVGYIAKTYPQIFLIAGNVCTPNAARRLWNLGADAVKAGIGGSGVCSTRLVAGAGYPQLDMIRNIAPARKEMEQKLGKKLFLVSDGGHRIESDYVKSLCFADLVMSGGFFAGCDESPGELNEIDGVRYKRYDGSSTLKDRVEGVKSLVPSRGPLAARLEQLKKGIQSGCSYQGVFGLVELREHPQLVKISNAAKVESYIHDVRVI